MTDTRKLAVGKINSHYYQTPHEIDDLDPELALVKAIKSAKKSIYFACYAFTLSSVADAILDAHKRGVEIHGVADRNMATGRGSQVIRLAASGIDVRLYGGNGVLMHDKVLVVDGTSNNAKAALGSFNWSNAAEKRNVEVLLISTGIQVSRGLAPALVKQIMAAHDAGTDVQIPGE